MAIVCVQRKRSDWEPMVPEEPSIKSVTTWLQGMALTKDNFNCSRKIKKSL